MMQVSRKHRPSAPVPAPIPAPRKRERESFGVFSAEQYATQEGAGQGTNGRVMRAIDTKTGNRVAIKVFKVDASEKQSVYARKAAIELKMLSKLQPHPHILALTEAKLLADAHGTLHMVTEAAEWDWQAFILSRHAALAPVRQLKGYVQQALLALQYCHDRRVVHRDVKPANMLITAGNVVKLADFGMASRNMWDDAIERHTEVVTTLWQRAPEVLVGKGHYDYKVDVWSMAMTALELFMLRPFLPGRNDEHQLALIYGACGTPRIHEWDSAVQVALRRSYKIEIRGDLANALIQHADSCKRRRFMTPDLRAMLQPMLTLTPKLRCTTTDALHSTYLASEFEEQRPYTSEQMIHYQRVRK
jgi:serine/threonine protein kinase